MKKNMGTIRKYLTGRTRFDVFLLVISIVSGMIIFVQYKVQESTKDNNLLLITFWLFFTYLVTDRISSIFSAYSSGQDHENSIERINTEYNRTRDEIGLLPGRFLGRSDIVSFDNEYDGLKYCLAISPSARRIRNTVLRYGKMHTNIFRKDSENVYARWIEAKERQLLDNTCPVTEIVSEKIYNHDVGDKQVDFMKRMSAMPGVYYEFFLIDDERHAIIQMTIFDLPNGKEVLFGWEFPLMPHGPCFLTRNERLVEYFENYFLYCQMLGESPRPSDSIRPSP